ncbi:MAG: hypothetical protein IPP19_14265 [Verrucomicrobia bacterium]|nr:hypothetical protein [Verrucomicrobiota bacterium]
MITIGPSFFALYDFDGRMTAEHPELVAQRFLNRIGAEFDFRGVGTLQAALDYLDDHLATQGVLPLSINLRYSVLDPTRFDNDCWNFQLVVKRLPDGSYRMFDMYHGSYYEASRARIQSMIDTPFNYRHEGRFTPFMQIAIKDAERTREALAQFDVQTATREAIDNYPFVENQAHGLRALNTLRERFLTPDEPPGLFDDIYRVMGFLMVIIKGRTQFVDHLREIGWEPGRDLEELGNRWNTFAHSVAMTMGRRSSAEYDRLVASYEELITWEHAALSASLVGNSFSYPVVSLPS